MAEALIALDVGDTRVGVAIRHKEVDLILPIGAFLRANGEAEQEILRLIRENQVTSLIVGLPLGEKGELTSQAEAVQKFCRRIERRTTAKVTFWDEYGSSVEANERLPSRKNKAARARRQKGVVDATAAAIILEQFLENRK